MPVFDTPGPIEVTIDLPAGAVRIVASDRADTVVELSAQDDPGGAPSGRTRVEFLDGRLLIKAPGPRGWGAAWGLDLLGLGWREMDEVTIALPGGSRVHAGTDLASLQVEGQLGECRARTGYGDIRIEHAGPVDLRSGSGEIVVDRVDGHAEIATRHGDVRVGRIDGSAVITGDDGRIVVGDVTGKLRVGGTYGDISVERSTAEIDVRNAYGSVQVREAVAGAVAVTTTYGEVEIGIARGTAAWLDIGSSRGTFRNRLDECADADGFDRTVSVHARTDDGDIVVRRA